LKRGLLFLALSALLVSAFYYLKYFVSDRTRLLFFTLESRLPYDETARRLAEQLKPLGLAGSYELPNGRVYLACLLPETEELLSRLPELSYLLPCSVVLYRKRGSVYAALPREVVFLAQLKNELKREELSRLLELYAELRKAVREALSR